MTTRPLRKGDLIRLKVRTAFKWKGLAVVAEDQLLHDPDSIVAFHRLGHPDEATSIALRKEVALVRDDQSDETALQICTKGGGLNC